MVTIAGNGMGGYDFSNLSLDISKYERVLCDVNFEDDAPNLLKLKYKDVKNYILEHYEKENILYVVTGSPLFFSAGVLIAKQLPKDMVKIIDNTSSKFYMLSRFCIAESDIDVFSLHGRSEIDLTKCLSNRYTFVLCDKESIERLKEAFSYLEPHDIEVHIGYKLGYADEVIEQINIFDYSYRAFDLTQPYVLLIKRNFTPLPNISSEESIEHENGMITKSYKRHISLQNLELQPNMLLWDIGAGSGSVSIDGYKRYKVKTILFEKNLKRSAMIKNSLTKHKVIATKLYEGEASELYKKEKSTPERIFVGGGGEKVIAELPYLYERLAEGGILVANFVTLTNLTQAITVLKEASIEFEVKSISLTTYKMKLLMPEPERVMHQIVVKKDKND
ncbi:bifunctional cobalt-precorrin-7 (C(5))-methyltransferase/cobalt-precorrin-6B (C(15))-methyltransferase [Sulfurimonas sp.]